VSEARLLLGASNWTGDGWLGSFYPENANPQEFLPLYAEHFNTVEIDSTFYRIPTAQMVKGWWERTPEGFIFAAKIPQIIIHKKVLVDAEDDLIAFLKVMDILEDKLGPLLFQFPYFNREKFRGIGFFLERLAPFLANLPKGYQWALEVRNKNWLSEKLYSVLRMHGVALALVDQAWMLRPKQWFETGDPVTADFTFIRWIGDRKAIEERTKVWNQTIIDRTDDLLEWAEIIKSLRRRVRLIYAYANNHYGGYAPDTIKLFQRLWSQNQPTKGEQTTEHKSTPTSPQPRLPGL
jgi:uncharacterized protein YecE (DUF72 family)